MVSITHLVRRLLRRPLVSLSVMLGIALSVALGVAVPLATGTLAALGLRATVESLPPPTQHIQLVRQSQPFNQTLQQYIRRQLGSVLATDYTMGYLPLVDLRQVTPPLTRMVRIRTQSSLAEHIVVTGRLPRPPSQRERQQASKDCGALTYGPRPVDVLISVEQLQASGMAVGDRFCIGQPSPDAPASPATITGAFVPKDPEDPYWFGDLRPIKGESPAGPPRPFSSQLIPVLIVNEDDFNDIRVRSSNETAETHIYRGFIRSDAITLNLVDDVARRLSSLRTDLMATQPAPITMQTALDDAITTFATRLRLLQSVLLALLVLLVIVAMIYVVLVGTLATQQQSNETALLRSRGASGWQILLTQIGQSLLLAAPGVVLGAGLGALGMLLLSRTWLFRRLGGSGSVPWRWTPGTWMLPGAILLVALLGLVLAARPALAHSQVTLRAARARPTRGANERRAQLDVLLLLFAGWGLWQLGQAGGSLTTTPEGVVQFNLLALATPALVLVAGSLMLLRLFPLAIRGLGAMLSRRRGLVAALSAWQLARDPVLYGRLALLLTLTVGLGIYSQVATATIARSQLRHGVDAVGADVRVTLDPGDDPARILANLPAAASTILSRVDAELLLQQGPSETQQGTFPLLGVDGPALHAVLAQSGSDDAVWLAALQSLGAAAAPLGLPLPPGAEALEVQLQGDIQNVTVYAKLAGANGEREVAMGQPGAAWQRLEARIPPDLRPPLTLQSLLVAPGARGPSAGGQRLVFDQLAARTSATHVPLQGFERLDAWEALGSYPDEARLDSVRGPTGAAAAELTTGTLPAGNWAALRFRVPANMPVYIAQGTSDISTSIGQTVALRIEAQRIEAVVQQRLNQLPGIQDQQTALIADLGRLAAVLNYGRPTPGGPAQAQYGLSTLSPMELRVALRPGAEAPRGPNITTKAAALLAQAADPLSNGVSVILLLGFGCALILSLIGFLTYSTLTIQAREIDWAVLGALGLSRRQILAAIAAEQVIVLVGSLLAGILAGLLLVRTTSSFVQVAAGNAENSRASLDWPGVALVAGALLLALAAALVLLVISVRRRGITRALRLGEV